MREIGFRTRYGLNVVGLKRNGVALEGSLADQPLLLAISSWLWVTWKLIGCAGQQGRDFVALKPEEVSEHRPRTTRRPMPFLSGANGGVNADR
ncbi:hypothetical protein ACNKHL_14220 [Shigella flexneri]